MLSQIYKLICNLSTALMAGVFSAITHLCDVVFIVYCCRFLSQLGTQGHQCITEGKITSPDIKTVTILLT